MFRFANEADSLGFAIRSSDGLGKLIYLAGRPAGGGSVGWLALASWLNRWLGWLGLDWIGLELLLLQPWNPRWSGGRPH